MPDESEVVQISLSRRLVAEVIGTMALVFVAVGADAAAAVTGGAVGTAARAVAPAMMVAALIYAIGDVSGAHFNPVVTTAFAMKRLFPPRLVPAYWLAQLVGAVAGALVVRLLLGSAVEAGVSTPHVASSSAVGLEVVLTLLLVEFGGPLVALAVLAGLIASAVAGVVLVRLRGRLDGDGYGALIEITLAAVLVSAALLASPASG